MIWTKSHSKPPSNCVQAQPGNEAQAQATIVAAPQLLPAAKEHVLQPSLGMEPLGIYPLRYLWSLILQVPTNIPRG